MVRSGAATAAPIAAPIPSPMDPKFVVITKFGGLVTLIVDKLTNMNLPESATTIRSSGRPAFSTSRTSCRSRFGGVTRRPECEGSARVTASRSSGLANGRGPNSVST